MCLEISRSRGLIDVDIMMWYDSKIKDQSGGLIGLDCLMYNGTRIKGPWRSVTAVNQLRRLGLLPHEDNKPRSILGINWLRQFDVISL